MTEPAQGLKSVLIARSLTDWLQAREL
jgi:hypothetical protein